MEGGRRSGEGACRSASGGQPSPGSPPDLRGSAAGRQPASREITSIMEKVEGGESHRVSPAPGRSDLGGDRSALVAVMCVRRGPPELAPRPPPAAPGISRVLIPDLGSYPTYKSVYNLCLLVFISFCFVFNYS